MTGKYLNFAKQNYNNGFYESCNERMKEKMPKSENYITSRLL